MLKVRESKQLISFIQQKSKMRDEEAEGSVPPPLIGPGQTSVPPHGGLIVALHQQQDLNKAAPEQTELPLQITLVRLSFL